MLNFNNKFRDDLKEGNKIECLVAIYPYCNISTIDDFKFFIETGYPGPNGEYQELMDRFGGYDTDGNYLTRYFNEACVFSGTTSVYTSVAGVNTNQMRRAQFEPIILTPPVFKESINIDDRLPKISNISLKLSNTLDGKDFTEKLSKCHNAYISIFWYTDSVSPERMFSGIVTDVDQHHTDTNIKSSHISDVIFDYEFPKNLIQNSATIPEKYRAQPVPLVYGEVDGAHASIIRKDFLDTGDTEDVIAFDSLPCEGFVDNEMAEGDAHSEHQEDNILYLPNNSQLYIAKGDYYYTILKNSPFWLGGDPDSFDRSDKANFHLYMYLGYPQYRVDNTDGENNKIQLQSIVTHSSNRNTISNDIAYVQIRDYFESIEAPADIVTIPDGRTNADIDQKLQDITMKSADFAYDASDGETWWLPTNIDGDRFGASLESFSNRTKTLSFDPLEINFWNCCTGYPSNGARDPLLLTCRINFNSGVDKGISSRHFTAAYYSFDLNTSLWDRLNTSNLRKMSNNQNSSDSAEWPVGGATTSFALYNGTFKTVGGWDIGNRPDIINNIEDEEVPKVVKTPCFTDYSLYDPDDAAMLAATTPVTTENGNVIFTNYFINQDVLVSGFNQNQNGTTSLTDMNFPLANMVSENIGINSHWENFPDHPGSNNYGEIHWPNLTTKDQEGP